MLERERLSVRKRRDKERDRRYCFKEQSRTIFSTKNVSVVQVDIQLQGRNSTLVPDSSILLGMTIDIWPLYSLLLAGR